MRPIAIDHVVEWLLFASRWLMAPLYLGLIAALAILVYVFFEQLFALLPQLAQMKETSAVLALLMLIDLSLVGNLLLTVMLAGYENFVSRMSAGTHKDWPEWIGKVDFSGMKLKLIASVAAISAIHLLEVFLTPAKLDTGTVGWLIAIQLAIVMSGVLLAAMDYISEAARRLGEKAHSP